MAVTQKEKEHRKHITCVWDEQIPDDVKTLFCSAIAGQNAKTVDRVKSLVCLAFESEGEAGAIAYLNDRIQNPQGIVSGKLAEIAEYECREALINNQAYNVGAYHRVMSVFEARLEGKEYSAKRPALGVRFDNGGAWQLSVEPKLKSSQKGWQIERIEAELRCGVRVEGGHVRPALDLKAWLRDDGTLGLLWYWKDMGKARKSVGELQSLLNTLAESPESLIRGSERCCVCGKTLSDSLSKSRGIGPECVKLGDLLLRLQKGEPVVV